VRRHPRGGGRGAPRDEARPPRPRLHLHEVGTTLHQEEAKGWEFAARAWDGQWGCPCARRCCGPLEVEDQRLSSWGCDSSVAYSRHGRSVYTAGADGMVCKIDVSDGSVAGKFKSSSKAISALAVSSG
uniref:Uncharacterized protein n=1 Tax=Aegilops tauschii subsp. strangulata TaxID=200361 RepID=A0A453I9L8_AEGTS